MRSEGGQVTPSASAAGYSPEQLEDMDQDEIDDVRLPKELNHSINWLKAAVEKLVSENVRLGPRREAQLEHFNTAITELVSLTKEVVYDNNQWESLGMSVKQMSSVIDRNESVAKLLEVEEEVIVQTVNELKDCYVASESIIAGCCDVLNLTNTESSRCDVLIHTLNNLVQSTHEVGEGEQVPDVSGTQRGEYEIMEFRPLERMRRNERRVNRKGMIRRNEVLNTEPVCESSTLQATPSHVVRQAPWTVGSRRLDSRHQGKPRLENQHCYPMQMEGQSHLNNEQRVEEENLSSVSSSGSDFANRAQSLGLLKSLENFSGTKDKSKWDDYLRSFLLRFPQNIWSDSDLVWLLSEKLEGRAKEYFDHLTPDEKKSFERTTKTLEKRLVGEYAMNRVQSSMRFNALKFDRNSQSFSAFVLNFEKLAESAYPELSLAHRKDSMSKRMYDILIGIGWTEMEQRMTEIIMDGMGNEYDRLKKAGLNLELMQEASKIKKKSAGQTGRSEPVRANIGNPRSNGNGPARSDLCDFCGKPGHWKRECRSRLKSVGQPTNRPYQSVPVGSVGPRVGESSNHFPRPPVGNRSVPAMRFGGTHPATGGNSQPLGHRILPNHWANRTVRACDHIETVATGCSPLVNVHLLGVDTLALVDSGAQVSTVLKGFLEDMKQRGSAKDSDMLTVDKTGDGQIFDVSGNPISHEGLKKIKVKICASGVESDVVFHVVQHSVGGEPVLLGTNALSALGVELMLRNEKGERLMIDTEQDLTKGEHPVCKASELHKVKVLGRVLVRPNEIRPVVLRIEGTCPTQIQMWSQDESRIASGLTEVDAEGNTVVLVHNNMTEPVVFEENEEIGEWEDSAGDRWAKGVNDESLNMLDLVVDKDQLTGVERVNKLNEIMSCDKLPEAVGMLIAKYEGIFALCDSELTSTHVLEHGINTGDATPLKQRARPVPVGARVKFKELMKGLLERGIVEPSTSPWASPIVLVAKKDGSIRLCIDYRELNKRIKLDSFPLPRIDEMIQTLNGKKVFSSLDLHSGFWQIRLTKEAREVTAFTTTEGLYQFKVLPFGLATSPAVFQRLMAGVLDGVSVGEDELKVYIDDILVSTDTVERHLVVLEEIFKALDRAGLCLKPSKCELLKDKVKYLGHVLTGHGVEADPGKVKAVTDFPQPKDVGQLRSFLGLCGYYRKFILGFSKVAKPLTDLTSKTAVFIWGDVQEKAFESLKKAMCAAPVLTQPDFEKAQNGENPFILFTDACKEGVGGVLCQKGLDGFIHPIHFISKGLTKAEKNYTITDLEGLAVVHSVQRLQSMLYDMHFVVKTDHQPLCAFFKTGKNDRVLRWALALQAYGQKMKIEYVPGKENVVADALSRCRRVGESVEATCEGQPENLLLGQVISLSHPKVPSESNWLDELKKDEIYSEIVETVQKNENGCWKLPGLKKRFSADEFLIENGLLWVTDSEGTKKKVVPRSVRRPLYDEAHGGVFAGHFSPKKVTEILKKSYFWEGLSGNIAKWHQECTKCYIVNTKGVNTPPLKPVLMGKPYELVGVDLLELGATVEGNKYALVMVDNFSKWMAAYPIKSKTAEEVANVIVGRWICDGARWPVQFLSDMGTEFMNKIIDEVKKVMGVQWVTTKGYNPRENGLVERANGTILRALKKKMVMGVEWDKILPYIVYSYNTTPHTTTGESPYFLLHGMDPPSVFSCNVPHISKYIADVEDYRTILAEGLRIAREMAAECMEKEMCRVKEYYDKNHSVEKKWCPRVGDRVYVRKPANQIRDKLDLGYSGPMRVIEVTENSASVVDLKGTREPVRLPFDWLIRVPPGMNDDQIDDGMVRNKKGRPRKIVINRIYCRNAARVWVPVASLDYRCRGEAIVQGRVNRQEQDCCSLFSKCLGDLNIIGFPRQLDSVKITSLGQLVNICGLVSEFLAGSVIEDYLVRKADTAFDTRDLTVDMIAEGLKIAASKCCHLDVLLRENSANPVEICRSTVWDVSEAVLRQALARAYRLRAAQLRGPAAQLTFVARKTAEAFGRSLKDEIIFDNYAEIAQHLSRSGLKNIEVVVMVGDRTIGRMEELIPPVLHSGTKIGVVSAPYGTITESGLLDARSGYEQLRMRLSTTAVLTYSLLPEVAAISYYHACGEEPIKKGFNTLDTHKAALFAKSLRDTLRKTALIDAKATTWLGVPTVIATSSTRGMSRGGGRGGRGGGRGGRGGRGRGDGSRGEAHRQGGRSTTHEHQSFLHRTHNGGV